MPHTRSALVFVAALLCLLATACGGTDDPPDGDDETPGCLTTCGANARCTSAGTHCECLPGFVDCDGAAANGCEKAGSCDDPTCTYEGATAFCARHEASCGSRAGTDNCDKARTVDCGSCPTGEVCGAEAPNVCGPPPCEAETQSQLCSAEGRSCGITTVVDSCGNQRRISCGGCATYESCKAGACEENILGNREACFVGGTAKGTCGEGMVCAGDETWAICVRTCMSHDECPGAEQCAFGAADATSGEGICGDLRTEGESCHWETEGADFCWDLSRAENNDTLACIDGTCSYVCALEGGGTLACPDSYLCDSNWRHSPDLQMDVKLCEEGTPAGDGEICMQNDQIVAPCAGDMVCVDFGGGEGRCQLTCMDDTACPGDQTCALGYLLNGMGVCGTLAQPGEACGPMENGEPWCWDAAALDSALICLEDTCAFICDAATATEHPAWPCPDGFTCGTLIWRSEFQNYIAECVDQRADEKESCTADADCLPGLACVSDGTTSVCQPICTVDTDCDPGRTCRAGVLADGRSACITPRAEGESCATSVQTGSNLCVDDAPLAGNSLECVGSSCRYVCDWENDAQPAAACPTGLLCSSTFRTIPGHADRGAICEPPCVPQTDTQLCSQVGAGCGSITTTDRCGSTRTVSCGRCATGSACNGNSCLSSNIPVNGACLDRNGNGVACAAGLTCVVWGSGADEYGACKQSCFSDFDCPGIESCATGTLAGGAGICGTPRQQGQTCSSIRTGSNFCWSLGSPSGSLFDCLGGLCEYICAVENTASFNCPFGQSCGSTWETYPESPARLHLCE